MDSRDDLPQQVRINDEPDIVVRIPRPMQRRDGPVERRETERAVDETPEVLDEERRNPACQGILAGLPRANRVKEAKEREGRRRRLISLNEGHVESLKETSRTP